MAETEPRLLGTLLVHVGSFTKVCRAAMGSSSCSLAPGDSHASMHFTMSVVVATSSSRDVCEQSVSKQIRCCLRPPVLQWDMFLVLSKVRLPSVRELTTEVNEPTLGAMENAVVSSMLSPPAPPKTTFETRCEIR